MDIKMIEKVRHLIVDTSGFLNRPELREIGKNIYTVQHVVEEVTSKSQIRKLVVLPFDLHVKEPSDESVKFITEFSKKTGDYHSLSATDIRVMALTYQMELEHIGSSHLRTEPHENRTVNFTKQSTESPRDIIGFYIPSRKTSSDHEDDDFLPLSPPFLSIINEYLGDHSYLKKFLPSTVDLAVLNLLESSIDFQKEAIDSTTDHMSEYPHLTRWMHHIKNISQDIMNNTSEDKHINSEDAKNFIHDLVANFYNQQEGNELENLIAFQPNEKEHFGNDDGFCDDDYEDQSSEGTDDDEGWITPHNIKDAMKKMSGEMLEEKEVVVGCLTTDFAMQNVLKQIGLSVVSLDGRAIRELRTYLLRCYACFYITSNPAGTSLVPGKRTPLQGASIVLGAGLKYQFCPKCGYQGTLKRVSVTVDENGKQNINVSCRRPITAKGKIFSIPKPKGGKHSSDPIICADQRVPQRHPSRLARTKTDALNPDYIAGFSPFVMRDINSRAAMLGIHGTSVKHWLRRNPNENKHGRRKKK